MLMVSPVGLSAMNRLSPAHLASLIMGTWFFASATAVLGSDAVDRALPGLEVFALSPRTRRELRAYAQAKLGIENAREAALARGVFGSPFFIVDGEPFWGVDRMPMIEDWIRTGGW